MIERTYTFIKRLMLAVYGGVGGAIFGGLLLGQDEDSTSGLIVCVILGAIIAELIFAPFRFRGNFMKKRPADIEKVLRTSGLAIKERGVGIPRTRNFSVLADRDAAFHTIIAGDGWHYGDHTSAVYERTKNSEYKAATIYYSVVEIDLPRVLPNMVFDAQRSHKKQFTPLFDKSQRQSLEGNFDQHFATYFPTHYNIDALSIITPEVMQAMIAANQYDMEIAANKLYLYGPLVPSQQVPQMIKAGLAIRDKLMNNLTTYRDDRLSAVDGRKSVSVFGAQLRDNPYKGWGLGLTGAIMMVLGIAALFGRDGDTAGIGVQLLTFGFVFVIFTGYHIWSIKRKNQQLEKSYEAMLATIHPSEKPAPAKLTS